MFQIENVQLSYNGKLVLDLPHLAAQQGEQWMVLGMSGSGKTTLLHILAGVLRPDKGSVTIGDTAISALPGGALDRFRGRHIGLIFQQLHLLPTLSVRQNLLAAPFMAGLKQDSSRVDEVLESLGITEKADAAPDTLSFGQKQRVAIARAVMNRPSVILADEPTSALDDDNCRKVLELLMEQARLHQATLLIATHDQRIKPFLKNTVLLQNGKLHESA